MPGVDELQDPVGYTGPWLALAVGALVLVAVYYAVVLWTTRSRRPRPPRRRAPRAACLDRLTAIETAVAAGAISAREGHQQISETVRGFVADASGVPARSMTLADLRAEGPERLAIVVGLVYPPEFAPDEVVGEERFGTAIGRARELVSSW